jgi:hypothetical protein
MEKEHSQELIQNPDLVAPQLARVALGAVFEQAQRNWEEQHPNGAGPGLISLEELSKSTHYDESIILY